VTRLSPSPGVTAFEQLDGAIGTFHNVNPAASTSLLWKPQAAGVGAQAAFQPTASWLPGGVLSWLHREDSIPAFSCARRAFTCRTRSTSSSIRAAYHQGAEQSATEHGLLYAADSGSTAYAVSDGHSVAVSVLRHDGELADLTATVFDLYHP
jgi:hypothetical protein